MGGGQSSPEVGGFRVFKVNDDSPAFEAGLEVFFDFIVEINGGRMDSDQNQFFKTIMASENTRMTLKVFNIRTHAYRDVFITPRKWGGAGLLGSVVRYDSLDNVDNQGFRVLEVFEKSPASQAGLVPWKDFLLGTTEVMFRDMDELAEIVNIRRGQRIQVYVYNSESESIREVGIMPNSNWGGAGLIGADIRTGLLHRIPAPRRKLGSNSGAHPPLAGTPGHPVTQAASAAPETAAQTPGVPRGPETLQEGTAAYFAAQAAARAATQQATSPSSEASAAQQAHFAAQAAAQAAAMTQAIQQAVSVETTRDVAIVEDAVVQGTVVAAGAHEVAPGGAWQPPGSPAVGFPPPLISQVATSPAPAAHSPSGASPVPYPVSFVQDAAQPAAQGAASPAAVPPPPVAPDVASLFALPAAAPPVNHVLSAALTPVMASEVQSALPGQSDAVVQQQPAEFAQSVDGAPPLVQAPGITVLPAGAGGWAPTPAGAPHQIPAPGVIYEVPAASAAPPAPVI